MLANHPAALKFIIDQPVYRIQEKQEFASFDYEGENNKYVLVAYKNPDSSAISQAQRDFLLKILGAVNLTINDVALLNLANYPGAAVGDMKNYLGTSKLLAFADGDTGLDVPAFDTPYTPADFLGMKVIKSNSFNTIMPDPDQKRKLWSGLKQLFNVAK